MARSSASTVNDCRSAFAAASWSAKACRAAVNSDGGAGEEVLSRGKSESGTRPVLRLALHSDPNGRHEVQRNQRELENED